MNFYPQSLTVLKILRHNKLTTRRKFTIAQWFAIATLLCGYHFLGNGRNTVSRVLFRKRELAEFGSKLDEFCEKLGEFALAHKYRLKGTHWVLCPELREAQKTHWVWCLIGCTPGGSFNRTLLRRVLRRFFTSRCFLEGFLEGPCKGFQ